MYFSSFSTALLIGAASSVGATFAGQRSSRSALAELETLFGRQTVFCAPIEPPYTCERSCGAGYVTCIAWPTCYNPGIGEICCSNGDYCDAGTYCTDGGCCDNGLTLEECDATVSYSVIPPPAATTAAASSTTSAASTTSSTSTTSKSSSESGQGGVGLTLGASTTSTSSSTKSSTTAAANTKSSTSTATSSTSSTTSSTPVKQTPGSSAGLSRDSPLVNLVLGGLGVLLLL